MAMIFSMALVKIITSAFILHKASAAYMYSRNCRHISKSLSNFQYRRNFSPFVRPFTTRSMNAESHSTTDENSKSVASMENQSVNMAFDAIPSIEQLRTDPFMKQVSHAEFMVGLIAEDAGRNTDVLMKRLRAQLSHPDGIRGFMVTYLTAFPSGDSNSENDTIPNSLLTVLLEQIDPTNDSNELISLMCKNVVMPTAMKTQQTTEELAEQSASTANRAIQLLRHVLRQCKSAPDQLAYKAILGECHAIHFVTMALKWDENDFSTDAKQAMWNSFFTKWGYKSEQRSDISVAMQSVLQE